MDKRHDIGFRSDVPETNDKGNATMDALSTANPPAEAAVLTNEQLTRCLSGLSLQVTSLISENAELRHQVGTLTEDLHNLTLQLNQLTHTDTPEPAPADTLEFDFTQISRKEIYLLLIELRQRGVFKGSEADLLRFVATYTNLGNPATVRNLYYRYKI